MNISEKDLNLFVEYSLKYLLSSGDDINFFKEFVNENKLPKSTYNLILKYLEKGIYNNKMKVNKNEYIAFRNEIQQKLK